MPRPLVHDIPQAVRGRSLRPELLWARIATVVLATIAASFALYLQDLVALLGAFGGAMFAAALVPTVAIGFNWQRATAPAAIAVISASLLANFTFELLDLHLGHGFQVGALSLLISLLLFFAISFCSRPPELDPEIKRVMEM